MTATVPRLLAKRFDTSPASPAWWADKALDRYQRRRRVRAATHPQWAQIEARRTVEDRPGIVLLSEDLRMDDWDTQQQIATRLTAVSHMERLARRVAQVSVLATIRQIGWAQQRLARGWDDRSVWSLEHDLCERLGAQLSQLSQTATGYPGRGEYDTYEKWTDALAAHGHALVAYDPDFDPDTEDSEARKQNLEDAKAALHWAAENLTDLWD